MLATDSWKPQVAEYFYAEPPPLKGEALEFHLTYKGRLPAAGTGNSRAGEKHAIRKQLHGQLRELWHRHPLLRASWIDAVTEGRPNVELLADRFSRCGHRFAPLIREEHGLGCELEILFLRRDDPGGLVRGGGDLDNRLKVLFDGLRMPDDCAGVTAPEESESPFYCLLQDDALITKVKISTDRLLSPMEEDERVNDVLLLIRVNTRVVSPEGMFRYDF